MLLLGRLVCRRHAMSLKIPNQQQLHELSKLLVNELCPIPHQGNVHRHQQHQGVPRIIVRSRAVEADRKAAPLALFRVFIFAAHRRCVLSFLGCARAMENAAGALGL